ncbi:hypothetical protein E2C01_022140 [Portunus trituberculatus]|uniref:Uncharacterized protein n=1 Tax=Portunus trituberculatus TaxID=210409 RepID=A0A5B7E840_PORTR|nr:hypothetical protein [Portunus trituberculatus]
MKPTHVPGGDNGGTSPALWQLHETVMALYYSVKAISEQISTLTNQVSAAHGPNTRGSNGVSAVAQPSNGERCNCPALFPDLSFAIRKEIVEMEECRKCKDSLIFRGIIVANMEEARDRSCMLDDNAPIRGLADQLLALVWGLGKCILEQI